MEKWNLEGEEIHTSCVFDQVITVRCWNSVSLGITRRQNVSELPFWKAKKPVHFLSTSLSSLAECQRWPPPPLKHFWPARCKGWEEAYNQVITGAFRCHWHVLGHWVPISCACCTHTDDCGAKILLHSKPCPWLDHTLCCWLLQSAYLGKGSPWISIVSLFSEGHAIWTQAVFITKVLPCFPSCDIWGFFLLIDFLYICKNIFFTSGCLSPT